jgi:uncharacterized protein (TIGR02246 family)
MDALALVAVRDTIDRYAQCVDRGRIDDLLELFTADAVLETGGEQHRGRDGIRALFARTRESLRSQTTTRIAHHVSSVMIDFADAERAEARSYFLAVTEHGPDHWGRYRDTLVRDGDRWRFQHRVAITDGRAPSSWAAGLQ